MTERELDATSRLAAWQRDYGDKCTQVFNDDLRTVLGMVAEIERLRGALKRIDYEAQSDAVADIAREALKEQPCKLPAN